MAVEFQHIPHPHIASRRKSGPPKTGQNAGGFNDRFAVLLTRIVGTMWCAYVFAALALVALPSALQGDLFGLVQWLSQTFIQLVMLSVIMVGQAIMSQGADQRADATYKDADATFHEAEQIQEHLQAQDTAINTLLDKVSALEASLAARA